MAYCIKTLHGERRSPVRDGARYEILTSYVVVLLRSVIRKQHILNL